MVVIGTCGSGTPVATSGHEAFKRGTGSHGPPEAIVVKGRGMSNAGIVGVGPVTPGHIPRSIGHFTKVVLGGQEVGQGDTPTAAPMAMGTPI